MEFYSEGHTSEKDNIGVCIQEELKFVSVQRVCSAPRSAVLLKYGTLTKGCTELFMRCLPFNATV